MQPATRSYKQTVTLTGCHASSNLAGERTQAFPQEFPT